MIKGIKDQYPPPPKKNKKTNNHKTNKPKIIMIKGRH